MSYLLMVLSDTPLDLHRWRHHHFDTLQNTDGLYVYYRYDETMRLTTIKNQLKHATGTQYLIRQLLGHRIGEDDIYRACKTKITQNQTTLWTHTTVDGTLYQIYR